MIAVAAVLEDELPNTSNKNFRANSPTLPICQIARLLHTPSIPKHGAAPGGEPCLEQASKLVWILRYLRYMNDK
jgi:hypothetical protein